MSKAKRKVTVDGSRGGGDEEGRRKPSVFERLGPGAGRKQSFEFEEQQQLQDRRDRFYSGQEKCRHWHQTGDCPYGQKCKFQHGHGKKSKSKRTNDDDSPDEIKPVLKVHQERDDSQSEDESPIERSKKKHREKESRIKSAVMLKPSVPGHDMDSDSHSSDDWEQNKYDYQKDLELERKRQQLRQELRSLDAKEEHRENIAIELSHMSSGEESGGEQSYKKKSPSKKKEKKKRKISKSPIKVKAASTSPGPKEKFKKYEEVEKEVPKKKHKKKKTAEKRQEEDMSDEFANEPVEIVKHKKNKQGKIKKHAEQKPRLSFPSEEDDDEMVTKKYPRGAVSRSPSSSRSSTHRGKSTWSPEPYDRSPSPPLTKKGKKAIREELESRAEKYKLKQAGSAYQVDDRHAEPSSPQYSLKKKSKKDSKGGKHKHAEKKEEFVSDSSDSDLPRAKVPQSPPQPPKREKKRRVEEPPQISRKLETMERESRRDNFEREQADYKEDYKSSTKGKHKDKNAHLGSREKAGAITPSPHKEPIREQRKEFSPESQRSGSQHRKSSRKEPISPPPVDRHERGDRHRDGEERFERERGRGERLEKVKDVQYEKDSHMDSDPRSDDRETRSQRDDSRRRQSPPNDRRYARGQHGHEYDNRQQRPERYDERSDRTFEEDRYPPAVPPVTTGHRDFDRSYDRDVLRDVPRDAPRDGSRSGRAGTLSSREYSRNDSRYPPPLDPGFSDSTRGGYERGPQRVARDTRGADIRDVRDPSGDPSWDRNWNRGGSQSSWGKQGAGDRGRGRYEYNERYSDNQGRESRHNTPQDRPSRRGDWENQSRDRQDPAFAGNEKRDWEERRYDRRDFSREDPRGREDRQEPRNERSLHQDDIPNRQMEKLGPRDPSRQRLERDRFEKTEDVSRHRDPDPRGHELEMRDRTSRDVDRNRDLAGRPDSSDRGRQDPFEKGRPMSLDRGRQDTGDRGHQSSLDRGRQDLTDRDRQEVKGHGRVNSVEKGRLEPTDRGRQDFPEKGRQELKGRGRQETADRVKQDSLERDKQDHEEKTRKKSVGGDVELAPNDKRKSKKKSREKDKKSPASGKRDRRHLQASEQGKGDMAAARERTPDRNLDEVIQESDKKRSRKERENASVSPTPSSKRPRDITPEPVVKPLLDASPTQSHHSRASYGERRRERHRDKRNRSRGRSRDSDRDRLSEKSFSSRGANNELDRSHKQDLKPSKDVSLPRGADGSRGKKRSLPPPEDEAELLEEEEGKRRKLSTSSDRQDRRRDESKPDEDKASVKSGRSVDSERSAGQRTHTSGVLVEEGKFSDWSEDSIDDVITSDVAEKGQESSDLGNQELSALPGYIVQEEMRSRSLSRSSRGSNHSHQLDKTLEPSETTAAERSPSPKSTSHSVDTPIERRKSRDESGAKTEEAPSGRRKKHAPAGDDDDDEDDRMSYEAISSEEDSIKGDDKDNEDIGEDEEESKPAVPDTLEIDWSVLMQDSSQPKPKKSSILERYKPSTLLSRVGISKAYAGTQLYEQVQDHCATTHEQDVAENEDKKELEAKSSFKFKHDLAILHRSLKEKETEKKQVVSYFGPYRRALCARHDLDIRRKLCKVDKTSDSVAYSSPMLDSDLCKLSVQLFSAVKNKLTVSPLSTTMVDDKSKIVVKQEVKQEVTCA